MKKKICLMLLQVLIGCTALWAQDSIMTLTLDEAQKVAKEHNRTLKNASLDVQKAEATRWQTIASMLPQVN